MRRLQADDAEHLVADCEHEVVAPLDVLRDVRQGATELTNLIERHGSENVKMMFLSAPELQDYEQQTTTFDAFGWLSTGRYRLTAPGDPQFVTGAAVTPALARQLGPPLLGQWFADDTSAVISSALWRRLGGRRDIIGSAITLNERQHTITGVMAPAFQLPPASVWGTRGDTEVWVPLDPFPPNASRGSGFSLAYARRKPGVSLEQAKADAKRVATAVAAIDPERYRNYTAGVADLREATIGMFDAGVRAPLLILLGGAGLLLLIACANVATLLLARSVARARETAIRVALGASRRQLALRYFAEGALVSVAGAAAGVGLSVIFVRYILAAASAFIPRVDTISDRLDGARLQRGSGHRQRRARRPGAALAGDAHGAERGAL